VHYSPEDGIYAYFRFNEKEKYWIILNKTEESISVNPQKYKEHLHEKAKLYDVLENKFFERQISIPGKGFRILKVD
jgi:hypothetical protein